jgi:hypothetical protein
MAGDLDSQTMKSAFGSWTGKHWPGLATSIIILSANLLLPSVIADTTSSAGHWDVVFVEDFEKGEPGSPVGTPWVQRHSQRQVVVTNQAAFFGKQSAMYRYEVSSAGSMEVERGLFFIEAPIRRPADDVPGIWRITAALRFHPTAWTACTFRLRGVHWRPSVALLNSGNMLFLGGHLHTPVWSRAEPDRWYRVSILLREDQGAFDLEIGEEGKNYSNTFSNLPIPSESRQLRYLGFGYVGALVRYGQGRECFLDDVQVERWLPKH